METPPRSLDRALIIAAVLACIVSGLVYATLTASDAVSNVAASGRLTTPRPSTVVRLLGTVKVGQHPNAIAVDEQAGHVFVVNFGPLKNDFIPTGNGSVSMLDATTGVVLHTAPIGEGPLAIAIDAASRRVFILNGGKTTADFAPPIGPFSISVLDADTGGVVRTVALHARGPNALGVDERTGRVFVADGWGSVLVLNATTGAVLGVISTKGRPSGVAVDERTGRVFIANGGEYPGSTTSSGDGFFPGSMSMLQATTGAVLSTLHLGTTVASVAIDAPANRVVVVESSMTRHATAGVELLDAATGAALKSISPFAANGPMDSSNGLSVAVDATAHRAFVVATPEEYDLENGGAYATVTVLDTRNGHAVSADTLGSDLFTAATAVDERAGLAFVVVQPTSFVPYGPASMRVFDTPSGQLLQTVTVKDGATAIAVSGRTGRAFVAGANDTVSVFALTGTAHNK